LKVIYMSGYIDSAANIEDGFLDNAPFLAKPFSLEGLGAKVREVLDGKQLPLMETSNV
jgi:hypothetical protein